jgi:hypothetical protein
VWIKERSEEQCVVGARRHGSDREQEFTFTIGMAQKAGLAGKGNWQKWQADMLASKAVKRAVRAIAPDVLFGLDAVIEVPADRPTGPQPKAEDVDVVDAEVVEDHSHDNAGSDWLCRFDQAVESLTPDGMDAHDVAAAIVEWATENRTRDAAQVEEHDRDAVRETFLKVRDGALAVRFSETDDGSVHLWQVPA